MPPVQDTLAIDDVSFAVRWSRKRRTIAITIPRQGAPVVAAPVGCRRSVLESAVRGKLPWVRRKLGERAALPQLAPQRPFVAGETFPYLGRRYPLVLSDNGENGDDGGDGLDAFDDCDGLDDCDDGLDGGRRGRSGRHRPRGQALNLREGCFVLPRPLAAEGRVHLEAWYRRRAERFIAARVARFAPLAGVRPTVVTVRQMRSRWGSCTSRGRVSFAWSLVLLSPAIVDYVVVHELVHLRELNHGPRFWAAVEEILPDYRERRARLRAEGRVAAL
jgi:hypothetical protein